MKEKINKCCVCEKDTEGGWLAKDGEYYCNVCYDNDFIQDTMALQGQPVYEESLVTQ